MSHKVEHEGRAERALQLREQGLSYADIAERLGVKQRSVGGMLERAKRRRALASGEVDA